MQINRKFGFKYIDYKPNILGKEHWESLCFITYNGTPVGDPITRAETLTILAWLEGIEADGEDPNGGPNLLD